jgi:hypothetical protein
MDLASDFVFRPLPPIADDAAEQFDAAAVAKNPLGRLAGLAGKWRGSGFNVIWRPNSVPDQDRFLELNRTTETLEFQPIQGAIPNRGLLQGDINMFGLHYLQQISDRNLDAGLHFEPGIWAHVPRTTDPKVPVSIVRMASIPHGTTMVAQGLSNTSDETTTPSIPKVSIKPFGIGDPSSTIDFPEQTLTTKTKFRTPAPGLVGVSQATVDDPNHLLRAAIKNQKITSTIRLQVSTLPKPVIGGGTANTAFLVGGPNGPNADAVSVTSTFWLEKLDNAADFTQLQYTQTVLLDFNGLSWPHVTVATLRRVSTP